MTFTTLGRPVVSGAQIKDSSFLPSTHPWCRYVFKSCVTQFFLIFNIYLCSFTVIEEPFGRFDFLKEDLSPNGHHFVVWSDL